MSSVAGVWHCLSDHAKGLEHGTPRHMAFGDETAWNTGSIRRRPPDPPCRPVTPTIPIDRSRGGKQP